MTNTSAMTSLLITLRGLLVVMFLNHTGLDLFRRDRLGISGFEEGCNRDRRRLIALDGGLFLQCVEVGQTLHLSFHVTTGRSAKKFLGIGFNQNTVVNPVHQLVRTACLCYQARNASDPPRQWNLRVEKTPLAYFWT